MSQKIGNQSSRLKLFYKLMPNKVKHILLVSTPYEAWTMEEDGRLSEQINNEYRGLNLSSPPRLSWASSLEVAREKMESIQFNLVIFISRKVDEKVFCMGEKLKKRQQEMTVVVLTHQETLPEASTRLYEKSSGVDQIFFWSGDAGILLAIIKSVEDRLNVLNDTQIAGIRVIIFVEDSPFYRSAILPVLYKELVIETQSVIEDSLNEEHRLLTMRARPKILLANSYEGALALYEQFKPFVLGVISDVRYPKNGILDSKAGLSLLSHIKKDRFDIPLLLASSEPHNAGLADEIPAAFIDKNSPVINEKIAAFLLDYLGFGSFIFRMPDGSIIGSVEDLYALEQQLETIPDASFIHHCRENDFSRWLFSFGEVELASMVRLLRHAEFDNVETHRRYLIKAIRQQRRERLKGVIVDFDGKTFDPDTGFLKIGKGSLGGKARGLAFISSVLHQSSERFHQFDTIDMIVPQTLVITTEGFDDFIRKNCLENIATTGLSDESIANRFMDAGFPEILRSELKSYLEHIHYPLAVRSSSLLEDAQFKPYAGLYKTFIIANDNDRIECRLDELISAIKMVYASTFFNAPTAYSKRVGNRVESEKMAVIIMEVVGSLVDNFFYPVISGVAQSKNYYPFATMKPEDGIVNIVLGLGRAVMEGERNLRFSPKFPEILPQRSSVEDTLENAQQNFYALKMGEPTFPVGIDEEITLAKREVYDAAGEQPVRLVSSTYNPAEFRIRDSYSSSGYPVVTFASILKYKLYPLAELLTALLELGYREFGCEVEIEFSMDFTQDPDKKARFAILQIRPMSLLEEMLDVSITKHDIESAFCISHMALGNTINQEMTDLVYVKPDTFDPSRTRQIVKQISKINASLVKTNKKYILIGPGRWGSADHWLGIPVSWADISGIGAIVETVHPRINAEPSHGSHFFHNITALGINYLNVTKSDIDRMDLDRLSEYQTIIETEDVIHIALSRPMILKVDGSKGTGVILEGMPATKAKTTNKISNKRMR